MMSMFRRVVAGVVVCLLLAVQLPLYAFAAPADLSDGDFTVSLTGTPEVDSTDSASISISCSKLANKDVTVTDTDGGSHTVTLDSLGQDNSITYTPTTAGDALSVSVSYAGDPDDYNEHSYTLTNQNVAKATPTFTDPAGVALGIDEVQSSATIPVGYENKHGTLSYASSNTDVATVDPATGIITAVAAGSSTITVTHTGNSNYENAADTTYTTTVAKAKVDIVFTHTYDATEIDTVDLSGGTPSGIVAKIVKTGTTDEIAGLTLTGGTASFTPTTDVTPTALEATTQTIVLSNATKYIIEKVYLNIDKASVTVDNTKLTIIKDFNNSKDVYVDRIATTQTEITAITELLTGVVAGDENDVTLNILSSADANNISDIVEFASVGNAAADSNGISVNFLPNKKLELSGAKSGNYKLESGSETPTLTGTIKAYEPNGYNAIVNFNSSHTSTFIEFVEDFHLPNSYWYGPKKTDGSDLTAFTVRAPAAMTAHKPVDSSFADLISITPVTATGTTGTNYTFHVKETSGRGRISKPITLTYYYDNVKPLHNAKFTASSTVFGTAPDWKTNPADFVKWYHFARWSKEAITVTDTSTDPNSGIFNKEMVLLDTEVSTPDEATLDALFTSSPTEITAATATVAPGQNKYVYTRVIDKAGNKTYFSPNGKVLVDNVAPSAKISFATTHAATDHNGKKIFSGDVAFNIESKDEGSNLTLVSGIKKIVVNLTDGGAQYGSEQVIYLNDINEHLTESGSTAPPPNVIYALDSKNAAAISIGTYTATNLTFNASAYVGAKLKAKFTVTDQAGNTFDVESEEFSIDTEKPVVLLNYDNNNVLNEKYFNKDRTLKISIKDTALSNQSSIKVNGTSVSIGTGNYNISSKKFEYDISHSISQDNDYKVEIEIYDYVGNEKVTNANVSQVGGTAVPFEFVIDKTVPTHTITYDNNRSTNGSYYNANRVATISVEDKNFDRNKATATIVAELDKAGVTAPTVGDWNVTRETSTAKVNFTSDADYTFKFKCTDLAGNDSVESPEDKFTVDTKAPEIKIEQVEDKTAYNKEIAPKLTFEDVNLDAVKSGFTLTGVVVGEVEPNAKSDIGEKKQVITFENFENAKTRDDIYVLAVNVSDLAGNTTEQKLTFSVNRFGSTYRFDTETTELNGSYVQKEHDVSITEVNVDLLAPESISVKVDKDGKITQLEKDKDYKIAQVGGEGSWAQYTYTLPASNFAAEGIYRILIQSEDIAGNTSENTMQDKKAVLSFGVDKTAPISVATGAESGSIHSTEALPIELNVTDNQKLAVIQVSSSALEQGSYIADLKGDAVDKVVADGGNMTFEVKENRARQTITIVSVDAAMNVNTEIIEDIVVSSNGFVRFYENKLLFFGCLGGAAVVLIGIGIALGNVFGIGAAAGATAAGVAATAAATAATTGSMGATTGSMGAKGGNTGSTGNLDNRSSGSKTADNKRSKK